MVTGERRNEPFHTPSRALSSPEKVSVMEWEWYFLITHIWNYSLCGFYFIIEDLLKFNRARTRAGETVLAAQHESLSLILKVPTKTATGASMRAGAHIPALGRQTGGLLLLYCQSQCKLTATLLQGHLAVTGRGSYQRHSQ